MQVRDEAGKCGTMSRVLILAHRRRRLRGPSEAFARREGAASARAEKGHYGLGTRRGAPPRRDEGTPPGAVGLDALAAPHVHP